MCAGLSAGTILELIILKLIIYCNYYLCYMSEKYKTTEDGLYFVSFNVVGFMDVFTRRRYQEILVESFIFCQIERA